MTCAGALNFLLPFSERLWDNLKLLGVHGAGRTRPHLRASRRLPAILIFSVAFAPCYSRTRRRGEPRGGCAGMGVNTRPQPLRSAGAHGDAFIFSLSLSMSSSVFCLP